MKKTKKRLTKFKLSLFVVSMLSSLSLFSIGFASWTFISGSYTANISVKTASITEIENKYMYLSKTKDTQTLKYNEKGLVKDNVVGNEGEVIFYIIFDSSTYLTTFSKTSDNVYFTFDLSYSTYDQNYILLKDCLTSLTFNFTRSDSSTSLLSETISLTKNENYARGGTTTPYSISSNSSNFAITLTYNFDVSNANYSSIYTNELSKNVSFVLKMNAYGESNI